MSEQICRSARIPDVDVADRVLDDRVHTSLYTDAALFEAEKIGRAHV